MSRLLILIIVSSSAAWAQVDDFALPQFAEADAGLPAPSAPPLPEVIPLAAPRTPPPPSWSTLGGSAALLVSGLTDYSVGVDLALMATLAGTPVRSEVMLGEVEGWLLQAGVEAGYAKAGGPRCSGPLFCAARILGGLAVKGGWARGLPHAADTIARPQTMYFGQLDVLLGHYEIESAPLSPGLKTWELVTRLRAGLHFTSEASRVTYTGVTVQLAALVELIPVSSGTRGVTIGGCAGIGF